MASGSTRESNWVTSTIRISSSGDHEGAGEELAGPAAPRCSRPRTPSGSRAASPSRPARSRPLPHARIGAAGLPDHIPLDGRHPVQVHPADRCRAHAVAEVGDRPDRDRHPVLVGHGEVRRCRRGSAGPRGPDARGCRARPRRRGYFEASAPSTPVCGPVAAITWVFDPRTASPPRGPPRPGVPACPRRGHRRGSRAPRCRGSGSALLPPAGRSRPARPQVCAPRPLPRRGGRPGGRPP